MTSNREPRIRQATLDDAAAAADVWLLARDGAFPAVPVRVHSEQEVHEWFATLVLPTSDVRIAEDSAGNAIAVMVLKHGWLDQLYILPSWTGRGLGLRLLRLAKDRNPSGLQLWIFQSNVGARRFYERHGFKAIEETDGTGNEEGSPDVRYVWSGD